MSEIAFKIADSVRYIDDIKSKTIAKDINSLKSIDLALSMSALKVSEELTPGIYKSLTKTCQKLNLNKDKVIVYITPTSQMQARCISYNKSECLLTISSELVKLLNENELCFVIGHEIGHFLLHHNIENIVSSKESLIRSRAREISVDRIGLLSCDDTKVALKAIMKTISGLSDEYINLDFNALMNQIDHNPDEIPQHFIESSHPSLILRGKALLRFSFSCVYQKHKGGNKGKNIKDIDREIQSDLNKYGDNNLREEIEEFRNFLKFWIIAYSMMKTKGFFTKDYQNMITKRFDENKKNKLIDILSSYNKKEDRLEFVKEKMVSAYNDYSTAAPDRSKREINSIINEISEEAGDPTLLSDILRMI